MATPQMQGGLTQPLSQPSLASNVLMRGPAAPGLFADQQKAGENQALVQVTRLAESDPENELSGPIARLPVELDVAVPVRNFRVRTLVSLAPGQVIESQWGNGNDLPLAAGEVQLAWSEFEVVETILAVRITRLA